MPTIFHPLLAMIASSTDRELAKYVQFLKEENKINPPGTNQGGDSYPPRRAPAAAEGGERAGAGD